MGVIRVLCMTSQARLFQGWVIVVIMVIDTDNLIASFQQTNGECRTDKTSSTSNEYLHESCPNRSREIIFSFTSRISLVMRLAIMSSDCCLKLSSSFTTLEW